MGIFHLPPRLFSAIAAAAACKVLLDCATGSGAVGVAAFSSSSASPRPQRLPPPRRGHGHHPQSTTTTTIGAVASWSDLESSSDIVPSVPPPVYVGSLPDDVARTNAARESPLPVLHRDASCQCAKSQMLWLALECKNVEYLTVLEDGNDSADDDGVPRVIWSDGSIQSGASDPLPILETLERTYPGSVAKDSDDDEASCFPPEFYPKLSMCVDAARCNIMRFEGIMPRNSDPAWMSYAPFIFRPDGTMVVRSSHCVSLEELDEVLEEYFQGPFLCGAKLTAADVVWAPYLERYAVQMPLLYPGIDVLDPRSGSYEEVEAWYRAMERMVPEYSCRVGGDARTHTAVLERVVRDHNARATSDEEKVTMAKKKKKPIARRRRKSPPGNEEALWAEYASTRPWLASTPRKEAGLFLLRNRERIVDAAVGAAKAWREGKQQDGSVIPSALSEGEAGRREGDEALREVVATLLIDETAEGDARLSGNAREIAAFASDFISVPSDMGMIPTLALEELVRSAPAPMI